MNNWTEDASQTETSSDATNVMRFFNQMMSLPLAAFVYSLKMFVRTIQSIQIMTDEGASLMIGGLSPRSDISPGSNSGFTREDACCGAAGVARGEMIEPSSHQKEEKDMWDRESGENDLKVVRYWVLFDKRDYEEIFSSGEIEPRLNRTDGVELVLGRQSIEEFRGEKRTRFRQQLNNIRRPEKWRNKQYPPRVTGDNIEHLPDGDFDEYTQVIVEVIHQQARRDRDYEKDKVDLLGVINHSINRVSDDINRVGDDISSKIG